MISKEQIILTYFGIGVFLGITNQLIYLFRIMPVLYAHGSRLLILFSTFAGLEIPKYKEICLRENRPLIWYEIYSIIRKILTAWIIILLVCLIAFLFISSFIAIAKMMNPPIT